MFRHSIEQLVHSLIDLELEEHPLLWDCYVLKGYCFSGEGDYETAVASFDACISAVDDALSANKIHHRLVLFSTLFLNLLPSCCDSYKNRSFAT